MKSRWLGAAVLLLAAYVHGSSPKCTALKETLPNAICVCDDLERPSGWSYTCIDNNFEVLFSLKFIESNSVTFDCGRLEPNYKSLLQQLQLADVHAFVFRNCPLPTYSFAEILVSSENYTVDEIRIESKRGDNTFSETLFANISSTLKGLVITNNDIHSLPESIFSDFTRLNYLSLSDNQLKSIPEKIFLELSNLTTLEITNNGIESLAENTFQGLFQLEMLYLYKNKLKGLPVNLFNSLVNLKVLDLADNQLILLPSDIFLGLSQLVHVRLRGNWLGILPKDLFRYSLNLEEIDLSLNKFREPLPEDLLYGQSHLENVSLHDCNLTQIHDNFFAYSPNVAQLKLQGNGLTLLPDTIFRNNTKLKDLNLNFNYISNLPKHLFPNQKYLEKLYLYNNNISEIPVAIFEHAKNIKTLVLGHNSIRNASSSIFRNLPRLESIDLSKNNLSYFSLDFNADIKYIDLSFNNLTKMPEIKWLHHLKMENINLQHNKINSVSIPVLYSTNKRSPTLNLAYNVIQSVSIREVLVNDDILKQIPPQDYERDVETTVVLNANPFLCDCRLYDFYEYLHHNDGRKKSVRFAHVKNLTCSEPPALVHQPLISLNASQFRCDIKVDCPTPCSCFIRAEDNARIVNCSSHRLKSLPDTVPHNSSILFFQNNYLTHLDDLNNPMWQNLTHVFLDNNLISNLSHWNVPSKLRGLTLSGNRIRDFPLSLMNFTSNVPGFSLTLSGNPWNCNCSAKYFRKWLAEHYQLVSDVNKIMCANRIKQNGTLIRMSILTIPDDIMCPINDWPYKVQLIVVTTICLILALLLFIVSVLYYRNKQTVIAYVYIHMHNVFMCFFNEEDIDEDKIFDAFVSYSSSDRDVALMLIEELEVKDPHFQLCIHERNWIAGNPISWNIFNSVHNSRRTILVISKEFLDSIWFQVEFHTAYYQMLEDKMDRVIIIVKGELPPKDTLDKDLQYLLSTKTYLVWDEKWFWEKLKYALPHKKQILQNDIMALKDRPDSEKIKSVENQICILTANRDKNLDKSHEVLQNGISHSVSLAHKNASSK